MLFSLVAIMIFPAFNLIGQSPEKQVQEQAQKSTDFSEEDLQDFVDVAVKVNEIQEKNYQKIVDVVKKENLTIERFSELLEAQSRPNKEMDASAKELKAFKKANDKMMEIQDQAQVKASALVEKEIGMEKYQQIVVAYQQNEKVQAKIESLLEKKSNN